MKTLLAISLLVFGGATVIAQPSLFGNSVRSVSGQFVVHDRRANTSGPSSTTGPGLMDLEPTVLVVSCERIKQALAKELDAGRDWKGTINLTLRPARRAGDVARINVERFSLGWLYKVELPERLARDEFFRTIVQVLLLELANRTPAERSAEIPLWLSEGLTQRLLASREVELVLARPSVSIGTMMVEPSHVLQRDPDPLARAREILRNRPAPAIAELSWPEVPKFTPADTAHFQVGAQLFVTELLGLPQGAEKLRRFTSKLPTVFNWQTAFLQTYAEDFPNQLALEKWWALQAAHFVGRDHKELWTMTESAQKLDEALHTAIAVRTVAGDLPARADIPLQTVLREWDTVRQLQTMQDKILELDQIRVRIAPAYMKLVAEYQAVLLEFIQNRTRSTATFGKIQTLPPSIKKVALETITKLDALDERRQKLPVTASVELTPTTSGILPGK